jgi:uncharacterized protein (TIGR03067 family)
MSRIAFLFTACLLIGADKPSDEVKKELAKLEGEWTMVSGERDGQMIPEELLKTGKRIGKGDESSVYFGDQIFMKSKITVDPSKKPKSMDYTVLEGRNNGKKQLGIYEINGDTAKFCFADPDKDRPTEFAAKEGSGWTLSVWKKEKK